MASTPLDAIAAKKSQPGASENSVMSAPVARTVLDLLRMSQAVRSCCFPFFTMPIRLFPSCEISAETTSALLSSRADGVNSSSRRGRKSRDRKSQAIHHVHSFHGSWHTAA